MVYYICIPKNLETIVSRFLLEAPTRFELVIEVLQTFALPLGYGAICRINKMHYIKESYIRQDVNDSDGNRTRVTAVKGRCLNRLTTEPDIDFFKIKICK